MMVTLGVEKDSAGATCRRPTSPPPARPRVARPRGWPPARASAGRGREPRHRAERPDGRPPASGAADRRGDLAAREAEAAADPRSAYEGYGVGASALGTPCDRQIWLTLRWASPPETPTGRQLRIFERGDIEEERVLADLRRAGIEVSREQERFASPAAGCAARSTPSASASSRRRRPSTSSRSSR